MATVMVVDDAAFMREMLKNILIEGGHQVIAEASTGSEAIKLFKQYNPEITTMGITMPDMNGIEALIEIKKIDPSALIIMCSAMGHKKMVIDAIQAGASDFIVKPLQKERVMQIISEII